MDAGSFVIALLTAAGAAAGPAALGTPPEATAATTRCIAAPGEERSGTADMGRQRAGTDVGLDSGRDPSTSSSALAEELAQELADVVAESDDATSRRLAAALAAAGFEAGATGSGRQTTAARTDGGMLDDRVGDDRLDRNRTGAEDRLDRERGGADRLDRNQDEDGPGCADRGRQQAADVEDERSGASGANRSSDLEDVLSSRDSTRSSRSSAPVERGGSGIASALERGERTAG
ncbi:hypothetical protein [Pseudonocardia sp. DLS-67]